ncbi:MAG: molybdopterin-guanine dinucleotide biosynthesis protein B [Desulfobacteraceae bacterium]|nr:molybdopterin-guanine dinucleotide biosynthesis protein B [Desulfobacteraceae bacterium]
MTEIVAIVGGTDSGKTTLIEKLIPVLKSRGYRVGTVKHVKHEMVFDQSGKDSWRHVEAGAETVVVDAQQGIFMFKSVHSDHGNARRLKDYVDKYFTDVDIVLAEGYKREDLKKIEVYRADNVAAPVCLQDPNLLALVADAKVDAGVPRYGLEDVESIADMIIKLAG